MASSSKADISETYRFFWNFYAFVESTLILKYFETRDLSQN